jgi:ubiquinone/menaquinone biosynthesis C-methylase UbiE
MYPFFYVWFKGKNVKRFMNFKQVFHNLSASEFEQYYKDYDSLPKRETDLTPKIITFIINQLGTDKHIKILDVGCGNGYLLNQIRNQGYDDLMGVDLVEKTKYPDIPQQTANIENLPFEDSTFDTVICCHTLEHVIDIRKAVSELKRVAAKKLIVVVPRQRFYKYTFDLHIHFFPEISYLLQLLEGDQFTIETYQNIKGDWVVVCQNSKK